MIWNEKAECMDQDERREIQLSLLQKQVKRVYENVPFYRKKFDDAGFHPDDLKTLDDISKIPFTTKDDLRQAYPFGLFAVPEDLFLLLKKALYLGITIEAVPRNDSYSDHAGATVISSEELRSIIIDKTHKISDECTTVECISGGVTTTE